MRRPTYLPLVILTVVLCFGVTFAAKGKEDDSAKRVTIKDLKFAPAKLTIKTGETVVWTNKDDNDHNVTADDGSFKTDDNLRPGDSFKHTFDKKGKFPYSCTLHPRMKGIVLVSD
jgi:plastocyanin